MDCQGKRFGVTKPVTTIMAGVFALASICAADDAKPKRVFVEVANPAQRALARGVTVPATVMADEQVDLYAKTSGYVEDILVDIGAAVAKGDVLVRISVPEMADELRQAEAVLMAKHARVRAQQAKANQAQRMIEIADADVERHKTQLHFDEINLERKEQLRTGNAIPEQMLDDARAAHAATGSQFQMARARAAGAAAEKQSVDADAEVAQAEVAVTEAEIRRLKTLIAYASIRAPFDGIIIDRHVDHGAFIRSATEGSATALLRIAKIDRVRIAVDVPELDTPFVRNGTGVEIVLKALGGDAFHTTVSRTAGAIDPRTRTMRIEIDVDNARGRLIPGMYAQVVIELENKERAMFIPSKALRTEGEETVVLVSANGVAAMKVVKVGYDDGIWAEILGGLNDSDQVIISTGGGVTAGVAVSPVQSGS